MKKSSTLMLVTILCITYFSSCKKTEEVRTLKDSFEPTLSEPNLTNEDFVISLHARALQKGERGEWKILSGLVLDNFVFFEDKHNPFTKFKGIPGEEYKLIWTHWNLKNKESSVELTVVIPPLDIKITNATPSNFKTIITLQVNPKYRGTWSITPAYARLESRYMDGYSEPPEKKPVINIHGYANTNYTATYTYKYAGKEFKFHKTFTTEEYQQEEALYELNLSPNSREVRRDNNNNIIELNLQASGIAWIMNASEQYPSLKSLKWLRNLNLGGSSLGQIPNLFGDAFINLEELNLDRVGRDLIFPENFGNLTKLKKLIVAPLNFSTTDRMVTLPKSFGKLKSLESFITSSFGLIDFNGTLGELDNLKVLELSMKALPDNIGKLKKIEKISSLVRDPYIPSNLSNCENLKILNLRFLSNPNTKITLPADIHKLIRLERLELNSSMLHELPDSFSDLKALKTLYLKEVSLKELPQNFGNLSNLENLELYGKLNYLPESFGNLNKLKSLSLGGNLEELPESFGNLSSLTNFYAAASYLKRLPESFGNLKNLKDLNAQRSKLESLPESFGNLDALERLSLNNCKLTALPKSFFNLKNISIIYLSGNAVGDIPDDISKMKTGVVFYLNQVPNLDLNKMNHILSISKGKTFYTDFGYFYAPI
jgi:Leucine-rich repeat (LRR) protein